MFTKRHEQELSEIKALTRELGERFQQVVEQLARIQEAQEQLAAQSQPTTGTGNADSVEAPGLEGGTPGARPGAKKARRREASAPDTPAAGTKAGKRRTKAGRAGRAGKQADGGAGKQAGGARKRHPPAEPAVISGSDEG
jgi:hypothetical protein